MRPLAAVLLAGLTASAGVEAWQLYSGVAHSFRIAPQSEEALIQDLTFPVIPGTRRLTIELETEDPSHDLDLFVSFSHGPSLKNTVSSAPTFPAPRPGAGAKRLKSIPVPLRLSRPAFYYIALKVKTLGTENCGHDHR